MRRCEGKKARRSGVARISQNDRMSAFKSVRQLRGIFLQYRNFHSESFGARQRSIAFIPVYVLFIIVCTTKGINSFQLLKFKSFKLIIACVWLVLRTFLYSTG